MQAIFLISLFFPVCIGADESAIPLPAAVARADRIVAQCGPRRKPIRAWSGRGEDVESESMIDYVACKHGIFGSELISKRWKGRISVVSVTMLGDGAEIDCWVDIHDPRGVRFTTDEESDRLEQLQRAAKQCFQLRADMNRARTPGSPPHKHTTSCTEQVDAFRKEFAPRAAERKRSWTRLEIHLTVPAHLTKDLDKLPGRKVNVAFLLGDFDIDDQPLEFAAPPIISNVRGRVVSLGDKR